MDTLAGGDQRLRLLTLHAEGDALPIPADWEGRSLSELFELQPDEQGRFPVLRALAGQTDPDFEVIVADDGTWRPASPRDSISVRGRGIPLMNALTDHAVIEPTDAGTRVCLQWHDITATSAAV